MVNYRDCDLFEKWIRMKDWTIVEMLVKKFSFFMNGFQFEIEMNCIVIGEEN